VEFVDCQHQKTSSILRRVESCCPKKAEPFHTYEEHYIHKPQPYKSFDFDNKRALRDKTLTIGTHLTPNVAESTAYDCPDDGRNSKETRRVQKPAAKMATNRKRLPVCT